ncbi:MAG: signal peptidase I [Deltaproteobacteria bacterium]|nr:signal peptidase I [Deltaproteobacteria bacterium]
MNKRKRAETSIKTIKDAIERYGRFKFSVKGSSMFPFIIDGDEVIIERVLPEDIRVGDIIMYIRDTQMIVHRITNIYTTSTGRRLFILRGDNLPYEDKPVWEEEIGGKATKVIRGDKEFTAASFHPIVISAVRYVLNKGRVLKRILGLKITQNDILNILRRKR